MATTQQSGRSGSSGESQRIGRDAVYQVNAALVDLLSHQAGAHALPFPLPGKVRERFTLMDGEARSKLACCGTLLVDIGLADAHRWRIDSILQETSNWAIARSQHWLPTCQAFPIAHATILIVWSILHSNPSEAAVLLGTSNDTSRAILTLGVKELSRIVERHPEWVQPRWLHVPHVWSDLLDFATNSDSRRFRLAPLRGLQMAGGGYLARQRLQRPKHSAQLV